MLAESIALDDMEEWQNSMEQFVWELTEFEENIWFMETTTIQAKRIAAMLGGSVTLTLTLQAMKAERLVI